MNFKALSQVILILILVFLPTKVIAARSIEISGDKTTLSGYEEMTVTIASMSGFTDGETIYFKGAFYKDGVSNYFGYTKNGNDWIKNSSSTATQRQIKVGSWDKALSEKVDFDDSGYTNYGEGDYKFKVGFYYLTSGGNLSAINWSTNSLDIAVNAPDPTATPNPTPIPTSPPTATTKPSSTPLPTLTSKPTLIPTKSKVLAIATDSAINASDDSDLLASEDALPTSTQKPGIHTSFLPGLFFALGGVILIGCGILFIYKYRFSKDESDNTDE